MYGGIPQVMMGVCSRFSTYAFERFLVLMVGGGADGMELMSERSISRGFPFVVD